MRSPLQGGSSPIAQTILGHIVGWLLHSVN
jgi:hypothetical protein